MKRYLALLALVSLSFAQSAPPSAPSVGLDAIGNMIPKVDAGLAFAIVLGILFLLLLLVGGVIFLFAVKKNWIVLNWPYNVTIFKPSGNDVLEFQDKAALVKDEKTKIMFRLKTGGFEFEIPDREFIRPGNKMYGWSSTMREFVPMKLLFEGYKMKPDPLVLARINACKDAGKRAELLDEYNEKLRRMQVNFKPVVDTATINSTVENTANIVKNTPLKSDWLNYLGLGIAVMIVIVTFMIAAMSDMKRADENIKGLEIQAAQAQALSYSASVMNESTQVNRKMLEIFGETTVNVLKGG
jgi:hypothetical protein